MGTPAGAPSAQGEGLDPVFDLPAVGVGELEVQEDGLGGSLRSARMASSRSCRSFGTPGGVLETAISRLAAGQRLVGRDAREEGRMRERPCRVSTPAAATITEMGTRASKRSTSQVDRRRPMTSFGTPWLGLVRARKFVTVFVLRLWQLGRKR